MTRQPLVSRRTRICGRYRRRARALLLSLLLVPVAAAGPGPGAPEALSEPDDAIDFGILPHLSTRRLLSQYQPLRQWLQRRLGRPVFLLTAPDFKTFFERTARAQYDLVITAPHFVNLGRSDAGYTPLAIFQPSIRGLLITAGDAPFAGLDDLRGQTLTLPNPNSLIVSKGLDWLAAHGLRRERDFRTLAAPNQDSAGQAILNGDSRAAILSNGEFSSIPPAIRSRLRIHTVFTEIPGFTIMSSPRLTPAVTARVREALLAFADDPAAGAFFAGVAFEGLRAVTEADLQQFASYDAIARRLLGRTR